MILFHWCRKINIYILKTLSFRVGGGQDKLAWTAYPSGVKIIRVGGKISREILPPGGQAVQGGRINCYTGTIIGAELGNIYRQHNWTGSDFKMNGNHCFSDFLRF